MDKVRSAKSYINQLKGNQIDHGDILAIKLAKIMGFLRCWWTEEGSKRLTIVDKIFTFFCCAAYFVGFLSHFVYFYQSRQSQSLPMFLGYLSNFLLALVSLYGIILFHHKRRPFSEVIDKINEKSWNMVRRSDSVKYRSQRNRIHLICMGIYSIGLVMGLSAAPALLIQFLNTGENEYENHFTANLPSYSFRSFVGCIFNIFLFTWDTSSFYIPIFTMIIEIFLIISLNYRVLADDLIRIEIGKDEVGVFKGLMKELNDLQSLIESMNEILWSFWTPYITILFYSLGAFMAVILTVDSLMETLPFVTVPLFVFVYLAVFCAIGQHVKDSADEVRKAAYNYEWYTAPIHFRKLLLMLLIRCEQESKLDAWPFFEMDFNLLKRVVNSTYAIMAVVLKMSH